MEFSHTAPVLYAIAIAIAEASDEPLDVPGAAADLEVCGVLDSGPVWRTRPSPTRQGALDVGPVILIGMHAEMPAPAQVTVLTPPGPQLLKTVMMRQVRV